MNKQPFMVKGFKAILLQDTGLGTSEYAARTCYNSFEQSENEVIKSLGYPKFKDIDQTEFDDNFYGDLKDVYHSDLLDKLAWTHHHYSIIEHAVLTYKLTMSRGVLQEFARHRIASPSVQSTRYTMKDIIDAYVASEDDQEVGSRQWFINKVMTFNMLSIYGKLAETEIGGMYDKLYTFERNYGVEISELCLSKEAKEVSIRYTKQSTEAVFQALHYCKAKRNAGDSIKFIVTDNWLCDVVWTINLRSLKNFLELRNSGAAWEPMQHLAQLIEQATPTKYLSLISKQHKGLK